MGDTQQSFYNLLPHIASIEADENGTIEYAGTRLQYMKTDMFANIFDAMEEVVGIEIRDKIVDFGVQAGQDIAERMDNEFESINIVDTVKLLVSSGFKIGAIKDIASTDDVSQWQKIAGYGRYVGWFDDIETVEFDSEEHYFECIVENCFELESEGRTSGHKCAFIPGVARGIMSYFWDVDSEKLVQEEKECRASGDDHCRIVVREK